MKDSLQVPIFEMSKDPAEMGKGREAGSRKIKRDRTKTSFISTVPVDLTCY